MKTWQAVALGVVGLLAYKQKAIREAVNKTTSKWTNLHPDMKQKAMAVIEKANALPAIKDSGYTVDAFDGWRSLSKQRAIMKTGNTWVSDPDSSYHVWGLAVDFVFRDKLGNWTWEPDIPEPWYSFKGDKYPWYLLGEIIEGEGLTWGGRWSNFDGPHGQLDSAVTVAQLKATYGTPDDYVATVAT